MDQFLLDKAMSAPGVGFDDADSGFEFLDIEYTTIPDVMYPWDPAVVKAIRTFEPLFTPIWIRTITRAPRTDSRNGEITIFGRHGFARAVPLEEIPFQIEPLNVIEASNPVLGLRLRRPTYEPVPLEMPNTAKERSDLPGGYMPFDWTLYYWARSVFTDQGAKEWEKKFIQPARAEQAAKKARSMSEHRDRTREMDRVISSTLENAGGVQTQEYLEGRWAANRKRTLYNC